MPLSHNPGQYSDVKTVLDRALEMGGGRYCLSSRSAAMRWRARAYMLRTLLFRLDKQAKELYPGTFPSTPYDEIVLRLEGSEVVIRLEGVPSGTLVALDGRSAAQPEAEAEDEMMEEARALARELEGK